MGRAAGPATRRVVITAAAPGGAAFLEIQAAHLAAQKAHFDEWHVWTDEPLPPAVDRLPWASARRPWACPLYSTSGTTCVRLAGDVCWLCPGFLETLFEAREASPVPFLVHANCVNNPLLSHLHQRLGCVPFPEARTRYAWDDDTAAENPRFARAVHEAALASARAGDVRAWDFGRWWLLDRERLDLAAFAWTGAEFEMFGGRVPADEGDWLCCRRTVETGRPSVVLGGAVCVRHAAPRQRHVDHVDAYANLAPAEEPPAEPAVAEPAVAEPVAAEEPSPPAEPVAAVAEPAVAEPVAAVEAVAKPARKPRARKGAKVVVDI